jgi:pentose-5-phosphate-3-epimerase
MTRNDKKVFIHKTQAQIIDTYNIVFADEKRPFIEIDGGLSLNELSKALQKQVVDMLF